MFAPRKHCTGRRGPQVIIPSPGGHSPHRCGGICRLPCGSPTMLTHAQIWMAIDRLAKRANLSASGLAKRAGLDPTTFNKSKRITRQGRERWPSTESVAKSLAATGISIEEFVGLITDRPADAGRTLPLMGFGQVSAMSHFDAAGFPTPKGWDEIRFAAPQDEHAYALEIAGDILQPTYRDGTVIVISPAAPVRRGDRVVVMTRT